MEFLKNVNWSKVLKIGGIVLLGLVALVFVFSLLNATLTGLSPKVISTKSQGITSNLGFGGGMAYDMTGDYEEAAMPSLSARNVMGENYVNDDYLAGKDAEDFEVTDYNATIETRDLNGDCQKIASLKAKDYVIFESSNESVTTCRYVFKVKKDNAAEILAVVEDLDPKNLTENTKTIKKVIEDYTNQTEILLNKKEAIEKTLSDALASYDEISRIATQSRDASSLATIIDSKVRMIERLTTERINITNQLDQLSRSKAEQLDRLEYIYFTVYMTENKYINGDNIKDSWKRAIKNFVNLFNKILQDLSINLILVLMILIQYVLYLIILVFTLKYVWKWVKNIWLK